MQLFMSSPYYPAAIDTVEKQTLFNLEALIKGIYSNPSTDTFPHSFVEGEAIYGAPVIQTRLVPTPQSGYRRIYQIAFKMAPGSGFDASGIWNYALPMSADLVLP